MRPRIPLPPPCAAATRQRGIVMITTLIVMIGMILAGIAMVRSIDTGNLIAGNLAFKQSAIASTDGGVEAAAAWLAGRSNGKLNDDISEQGYYANSQDCLDLTGNGKLDLDQCNPPFNVWNWDGPGNKSLGADAAGNSVWYVIHRMCNASGVPLDGANCAVDQSTASGNSNGSARQMANYNEAVFSMGSTRGYYRITVRALGPKGTASYVQAIVSM